MKPVDFKVNRISHNKGLADVVVQFESYDKEYLYRRKSTTEGLNKFSVIISGCKVLYKLTPTGIDVISITREYDTKGKYKKSTQSQMKGRIKRKEQPKFTLDDKDTDAEEPTTSSEDTEKKLQNNQGDWCEVPKGKIRHAKYNQILTCIKCGIPVYLAGPAGSGKNHTVEQIAKELDCEFYFSNSIQQEYKLTGFIDAGGRYHETEFYKACTSEKECIFFLDEMDASIPDVLVLLNAAIANGYFEFPNGRVDFDNVHFVAAGNTVGNGADDKYTGRMVLDSATLDRFAIIEFDYDERVELKITKGNLALVNFISDLRKDIERKEIRHTVSYRCELMVTKLEAEGMDLHDIMKIVVLKGLDQDTINTISVNGNSRYHTALKNLQT